MFSCLIARYAFCVDTRCKPVGATDSRRPYLARKVLGVPEITLQRAHGLYNVGERDSEGRSDKDLNGQHITTHTYHKHGAELLDLGFLVRLTHLCSCESTTLLNRIANTNSRTEYCSLTSSAVNISDQKKIGRFFAGARGFFRGPWLRGASFIDRTFAAAHCGQGHPPPHSEFSRISNPF